ncbi:MAG: channel protein hemolysin family [Solirubrobacterales bacterium]|nr:channel protein hemolysin family [Solirubrobacterales bacterium]
MRPILCGVTADEARQGHHPIDAAREAAEAAGERFDDARHAAGERIGEARDAAERQFESARDSYAEAAVGLAQKLQKPRWRGVSHQWAFFVSLVAGAVLVIAAQGGREVLAVSVYAFSLSALLGTSALYHRVDWQPGPRRWMRRLDHTMIFVLIAGTYTPFALLVMEGTTAEVILIVIWACAAGGAVLNLAWWNAPKWFSSLLYISTGWVAVAALPQLWERMGPVGVGLIALGGALYTAGAVVYATRRPDPSPSVFGYHEIFHLFVIAAAAIQYAAIAIYGLPEG